MIPPGKDKNVIQPLLPDQLYDAREEVHVRSGKNRKSDGVHIFLKGSVHDLLRSLAQSGIDNLHPGIPQGARNDFGPPVVTIQAGLGN